MIFKKFKYSAIIILGFILLLSGIINAANNNKGKRNLAKVSASQVANQRMDINNLNALESNVGFADYNLNSNLEGLEFPIGSGKNAVFEGGFLWGGYANGDTSQVRVGGSAYITGLQPGPIMSNGQPADPTDSRWSIYRVRPDIYPGGPAVDLTADVHAYAEGGQTYTAAQLLAQYISDWTNWPAHGSTVGAPDLGAPFTDVKGDGNYDPTVDIPGVPGADQTCYFVANDMDTITVQGLYGTLPLGIELHVTYWAYSQQGALGNMYFKKWEMINKGYQKTVVDSMFVSYWTDVDLGSATDDVVGCDTTLSMSFTYNGQASDAIYAPLPPPADGFTFFQGPIVAGNASDSAIFIEPPFKFTRLRGERNLPMTAAYYFINTTDPNYGDPPQGQPIGATYFYNFFNGEHGSSGLEFTTPQGVPTKFCFPGDPVAGTGWLDVAPADKRQGMASGPFTFSPGDTQQVVVACIFAGAIPSVNYLQAVTLVKTYDLTAQSAYDHFFNLPGPPPPPHVIATALNNKISLDWGEVPSFVSATENSVVHDVLDSVDASGGGNYKFEGYNVYQLPYSGASIGQATRIATYDLIDSVLNVPYVDLNTRQLNPSYYIEYGTDSGIKRFFIDSTDAFNGNATLHNGTPYYFAVTAYSYNPKGVPRALENPIAQISVVPQSNNPGVTTSTVGPLSSVTHSGTANATVSVNVVNPALTTGDKYQVSFHDEMYSLGANGVWTDVTAASKKLAKIKDLTGSYLTNTAVYNETKGRIQLYYLVNVVSSNFDYCDGVVLKLPAGVVIDTIISPVSNNSSYTGAIPYSVVAKNTIFFGDSTRTGNGIFAGGEILELICNSPSLPMITNYTMYDDDFSTENPQDSIGGINLDIFSTDTLASIATQNVTQHQWNVTDLTTGNIVLQNQTIYNGVDLYDPATYFKANNISGPGGSSHLNGGIDIGPGAVDFAGIQVAVNGSFVAPNTISSMSLNGQPLAINGSSPPYEIYDFTDFGYDGTAHSSLSIYNGGTVVGATDINDLQQSYDLRWTGVLGDTTINGTTVTITKSGGSFATLFAAHQYKLANDPVNPNPGSNSPFIIRIPFEVWNIDKNEQVNLLVYDRLGDPTKPAFQVWNTLGRMYTWVVNTKYNPSAVIDPASAIVADSATWNWVFFTSEFTTGDDLKIQYSHPLQIGKDTFTFTVPGTKYLSTQAKQDVNSINVFPNPYYGVNSLETTKYARFVTFNHLPATATIRIFNLAGLQVRVINHTNGGQFEQWDLNNSSGLPVASGLYIVYIDMPAIGATKILKAAIIQEQQFPDHF
jgi:hypothetical protein